jgi:allantoinase
VVEHAGMGFWQPAVLGIALHALIVGQPFRLSHLRRAPQRIAEQREHGWLTTAGAVAGQATAGRTAPTGDP